jgi:hypothetical protein
MRLTHGLHAWGSGDELLDLSLTRETDARNSCELVRYVFVDDFNGRPLFAELVDEFD